MNSATFPVTAMVASFGISACLGYPASHETFINQSAYWVGKSIFSLKRNSGPSYDIKKLPNGNMEEEWVEGLKCRGFYEYDTRTNIIVSWRFEGSATDCISVAP